MVVVGAAAALHADGLGGGDLDVIDILPIEERLEDGVAEAEGEQVLDGFLAQVVVDPIDLVRSQEAGHSAIQFHRAGEVVAEWLFDHDAIPRAAGFSVKRAGAGEVFDDDIEEARFGGEVEEPVAGQLPL